LFANYTSEILYKKIERERERITMLNIEKRARRAVMGYIMRIWDGLVVLAGKQKLKSKCMGR
jgi:hypothetical protein